MLDNSFIQALQMRYQNLRVSNFTVTFSNCHLALFRTWLTIRFASLSSSLRWLRLVKYLAKSPPVKRYQALKRSDTRLCFKQFLRVKIKFVSLDWFVTVWEVRNTHKYNRILYQDSTPWRWAEVRFLHCVPGLEWRHASSRVIDRCC